MYYGPDKRRYSAPTTFTSKRDARNWLAFQQTDIIRKAWEPPTPKDAGRTFADYAQAWLKGRRELRDRTREHYGKLLDQHLLPEFGSRPLAAITPKVVRDWYAHTLVDRPTKRRHAYGLLRTIMGSAVHEELITTNPCVIKGAGATKRVHQIRPASLEEIEKLASSMPDRYQAMVLLACWCALRFGELTELRRKDIELDPDELDPDNSTGVIRVRRGVVHTADGYLVGPPKSDAGVRDVAIPPNVVGAVAEHLARHVHQDEDSLLFPSPHGQHLSAPTLHGYFRTAKVAANRPDLRFHDLRHTGAVLAALCGATLAELKGRLGHSSTEMAMRYQRVAAGRDQAISKEMSRLAKGS